MWSVRGVRRLVSLLVLGLGVTVAGAAHAQPRNDAGALYREAVGAFEHGDYDAALARFQLLWERTRRPELLVNLGVCHERLGHAREAAAAYRQFLALTPAAPNRAELDARIARLEAPPAPVVVAPPPAPVAPPPVVAPPPPAPPPARPVWPWGSLGVGAGLTAAGALMIALPSDPGDDASVTQESQWLTARDARARMQTLGAIVGGVGVAGVVVGVVGLMLRPSSPSSPSSHGALDLRWHPLAGGGALSLSGRF